MDKETALAEYAQIKSEQASRIDRRDYLLYAMLAATGAVFASAGNHRAYLLAIPLAAFILGWNYLKNDHMISAIGRYFREHPALGPDLGWERDHQGDSRRTSRALMQLAVDLAAFTGTGLAGLVGYWTSPSVSAMLIVVSAIEFLALAALAYQVWNYSGIGGDSQ